MGGNRWEWVGLPTPLSASLPTYLDTCIITIYLVLLESLVCMAYYLLLEELKTEVKKTKSRQVYCCVRIFF